MQKCSKKHTIDWAEYSKKTTQKYSSYNNFNCIFHLNLLEEIKVLSHFDKKRIFSLAKNTQTYNLKNSTIDTYISRFLKNKDIIPLSIITYICYFI